MNSLFLKKMEHIVDACNLNCSSHFAILQRIFLKGNEKKSLKKEKNSSQVSIFGEKNTSYTVEKFKNNEQKIYLYFSIFIFIYWQKRG